jgi:iron complex transport system substrate-binding protein
VENRFVNMPGDAEPAPEHGRSQVRLPKPLAYALVALVGFAVVVVPIMCGRSLPEVNTDDGRLRVVSLSPSVTEMLFALEAEDSIVGVTQYCDYPPAAKDIERVGAFGVPNMEKLLALSPDLVIATGTERRAAAAPLDRAEIRTLWVKTGSVSEVLGALREIGEAIGKPAKAEKVAAAMQAELDTVTEQYRDIPAERRPRVFAEVWYDPVTTAGKGSFIDDLITRAGGINVAHEIDAPYPTVNPEKVVEWNPDVIVLGYMTQEQTQETLANRIGWGDIQAVQSGRIIGDIPSDLVLRPGPRLTEGVKALAQRIHGGAEEDECRD